MEVFDYAMQVEKEGEDLYRSLAKASENSELGTLFKWLADAEVRHFQIFKRMKENEPFEFQDSTILEDAVNIFTQLKEQDGGVAKLQVDTYRIAEQIEQKMVAFYTEKAKEEKDDSRRDLILKVADEEKRHQHVLENLIKFASNPETWLKEEKFKEILNYYPL